MSNLKHGLRNHKSYPAWKDMMRRCYGNNSGNGMERYRTKEITVCKRWHDVRNFIADMGEKPDGTFLDRINNDGNYCKENCRWATKLEQSNNTSANKFFVFDGLELTAPQWARLLLIA